MSSSSSTYQPPRLCKCTRCGGEFGEGKTVPYSTYMRHQGIEREHARTARANMRLPHFPPDVGIEEDIDSALVN